MRCMCARLADNGQCRKIAAPMTPEDHERSVAAEGIARAILLLRGQRVILDANLAGLYGVETRALIQAVQRNPNRFPSDFAFRLNTQEVSVLRSQIVISSAHGAGATLPTLLRSRASRCS